MITDIHVFYDFPNRLVVASLIPSGFNFKIVLVGSDYIVYRPMGGFKIGQVREIPNSISRMNFVTWIERLPHNDRIKREEIFPIFYGWAGVAANRPGELFTDIRQIKTSLVLLVKQKKFILPIIDKKASPLPGKKKPVKR